MEANDLKSMDADELWKLHEELRAQLGSRLVAEKNKLEERLRALRSRGHRMRPYPKVLPKYQNPKNPAEIWSGRGKLPRWLSTQIKAGKKLNNFLIASSDAEK
jgi:DNA-binding protein H-NS